MKRSCWWHGGACPDAAVCKRNGNYYAPQGGLDMSLHRPNRYGSWAEEAHARTNPGVPWDGIVPDLATEKVRESGWKWARAADGREGPVVKNGDKRELDALCGIAGVRMAEPGEILRQPSARDRLAHAGRNLRAYLERAR